MNQLKTRTLKSFMKKMSEIDEIGIQDLTISQIEKYSKYFIQTSKISLPKSFIPKKFKLGKRITLEDSYSNVFLNCDDFGYFTEVYGWIEESLSQLENQIYYAKSLEYSISDSIENIRNLGFKFQEVYYYMNNWMKSFNNFSEMKIGFISE